MAAAADASPPVEIAVLDFNSRESLADWINGLAWEPRNGNILTFSRYEGHRHYHMALAYNMAVRRSHGEWVAVMGTDAMLAEGYVIALRELIAKGVDFVRSRSYRGIIAISRDEFIAAGGYDERFEFYMGEDKELEARLRRRGLKLGLLPNGLVGVRRTPERLKLENYASTLTKREMMEFGARIRKANAKAGLLVANEGMEWGAR
jgi:hypothetical protein